MMQGPHQRLGASSVDDALVDRVRSVREALVAQNRSDLVKWLDSFDLHPADAHPVIVVAGETKRGKSAFVNALLGRGDLSPTGLALATNTFVRFGYADHDQVDIYTTGGGRISAEVADLVDWATEGGNPGNGRNVGWIDVGVPAALLEDLIVADTPGLGGLGAGHAEVTLHALERTDALLFVVDAGSPLTDPELSFLVRAAQRIDTLGIVLTKIDRHRGWREILGENAALISKHAPGLQRAPVFPVSSTRALDPDGRTRWGFDAIDAFVKRDILSARKALRKRNLARGCISALADMDHELALSQQVDRSAAARTRLAECQRNISAAKRQQARWREELESVMRRVQDDRSEQLHERLRSIRATYTDAIRHGVAKNAQAHADRLQSEITHMAAQLDVDCNRELASAIAPIAQALDNTTRFAGAGELKTLDAQTRSFAVPLPASKRARLADHLTTVQAANSGRYIITNMTGSVTGLLGGHGAAAAGLAALGPAGGFVTLPLAALYAGLMHRGRAAATREVDLRAWTAEQANEASFRLTTEFSKALTTARSQIVAALDEQLALRDQQLQRLAGEAAAAAARAEQDQERRSACIKQWRQWLATSTQSLESLLDQLVASEAVS